MEIRFENFSLVKSHQWEICNSGNLVIPIMDFLKYINGFLENFPVIGWGFDIFQKSCLFPHPGTNILCPKYQKVLTQGRTAPPQAKTKKQLLYPGENTITGLTLMGALHERKHADYPLGYPYISYRRGVYIFNLALFSLVHVNL